MKHAVIIRRLIQLLLIWIWGGGAIGIISFSDYVSVLFGVGFIIAGLTMVLVFESWPLE